MACPPDRLADGGPWARTLQVHICHQGVHDNLSGDSTRDRVVVEAVSTVLVVHDHGGYRADHHDVHHPYLGTDDDSDRLFTIEVMKIEPGASVADNRKRFISALLSPRVHALFLASRLKANFIACPPYRRLLSVAWLAVVLLVLVVSQKWVAFAVGFVLPMTLLYQMSAMCQFATEHFWVRRRSPGQTAKEHYRSMLLNRHLGDPLPEAGLRGLKWCSDWMTWWARLVLYHVPVRLGVLAADLPVHGSHHLWPLERRWTNAIYTYRELADQAGLLPNEVVGGYGQILGSVLESFHEAGPGTSNNPESPMRRTRRRRSPVGRDSAGCGEAGVSAPPRTLSSRMQSRGGNDDVRRQ